MWGLGVVGFGCDDLRRLNALALGFTVQRWGFRAEGWSVGLGSGGLGLRV